VLVASLDDDARKQADPFQSNRLLMLINENISPPGRSLLIFLTTLYHQGRIWGERKNNLRNLTYKTRKENNRWNKHM
jgi:hypothetical protein